MDDIVVRFDDGSTQYFQVKLALRSSGDEWTTLWAMLNNLSLSTLTPDDRMVLVLGEHSKLASDLREMSLRTNGSDPAEWKRRLTAKQSSLADSIAVAISETEQGVWRLLARLEIVVWPVDELGRDYALLWMPDSDVPKERLFDILAGYALVGASTRSRFGGAALRDRLSSEWQITVANPAYWGLEKYRASIATLASIEVPGTSFQPAADAAFLWPRCLRYDRQKTADFDDDLPGWHKASESAEVDLRNFPGPELSRVVLIAGPGFGKSTVVGQIARRLARHGLVPVVISIIQLSDADRSIADYLDQVVNQEFDVRIDWKAAAATGLLIVLLDGLDEVSGDRRIVVLERFRVYRATYPQLRWIMTVRDATALAPPEDSQLLELAPLDEADISRFVSFYRPGEADIVQPLLERIASRPDLAGLARIPIFLSLMLVMKLERSDLRRSDLLETYIETLLQPKLFKSAEKEPSLPDLRSIVERAAFSALESESIGVSHRRLTQTVRDISPSASPDEVREALVRRGLLRRSGLLRMEFPFPIVQEYLASAQLQLMPPDELMRRLTLISRRPWAQALQFALERHDDPRVIVDRMLSLADDVFHTSARLLGRCLANGMSTSQSQHNAIAHRLAAIWGRLNWRAGRLVASIVVDAFGKPPHPAVRARLGERALIFEGSGAILAMNRDTALTLEALEMLLRGDIDHLLHLGEIQQEVDRIGTPVFTRYIDRYLAGSRSNEEAGAISCLISHMTSANLDATVARRASCDIRLPVPIRLAAWSKSGGAFDGSIEQMVIEAMQSDDFYANSSAAEALSSADNISIVRLLALENIAAPVALHVFQCVVEDWRKADRFDRLRSLLGMQGLPAPLRDLGHLYLVGDGDAGSMARTMERLSEFDAQFVGGTVALLGHMHDKSIVESVVASIASRNWSANDRISISDAFSIGMSYRMIMSGLGGGELELMPLHPGRPIVRALLTEWLKQNDYSQFERMQLLSNAVQLGAEDLVEALRVAFDSARAAGAHEGMNEPATTFGNVLEVLHANGRGLNLEELEQLASEGPYNLTVSAVSHIGAHGTMADVEALARIFESAADLGVRRSVLSRLEPLAGRLSLKVTAEGNRLLIETM